MFFLVWVYAMSSSFIMPSYAFICVDALVDGKRAGESTTVTFMRVVVDATWKGVLHEFLGLHAAKYCPLPDSTIVTMVCVKSIESVHGKPAADVGSTHDWSVFLNYHGWMAMSYVPTKRFTFKCVRVVEHRQPRRDPIVIMMARHNTGNIHFPPCRAWSLMNGKGVCTWSSGVKIRCNGAAQNDASEVPPWCS